MAIDDRPSAFRYPRGDGVGGDHPRTGRAVLEIGKGRIVREGTSVAILSLRHPSAGIAEGGGPAVGASGVSATVADARFAKPLDCELVRSLAREHEVLVTVEEGTIGGFGTQVLHFLAADGVLDGGLKIRPMVLPDRFFDQDKPVRQYDAAGLLARHIAATALEALGASSGRRSLCRDRRA